MLGLEPSEEIGEHVIADLFGISRERLQDESRLMEIFSTSLKKAPLSILAQTHHKFAGGGEGVTGVFLLSKSHAAFHSYPETGYLAADVYSCGAGWSRTIVEEISLQLEVEHLQVATFPRPAVSQVPSAWS